MSAARATPGAASLSISSHFPTIWKSMNVKPVMFPPGCAKLETKPCSTGSLTRACRLPQCPDDGRRLANEYVWRERHEFRCVRPYAARVGPTKACLDLDVATVCPS